MSSENSSGPCIVRFFPCVSETSEGQFRWSIAPDAGQETLIDWINGLEEFKLTDFIDDISKFVFGYTRVGAPKSGEVEAMTAMTTDPESALAKAFHRAYGHLTAHRTGIRIRAVATEDDSKLAFVIEMDLCPYLDEYEVREFIIRQNQSNIHQNQIGNFPVRSFR